MSRMWTQEQEAKELAARFASVNQAKFAREHSIPGGPSMVSQHIKGHRPINMDAALAYAKGFGISLADVSPRLAAQAAAASGALSPAEIQAGAKAAQADLSQDDILDGMGKLLSSVPKAHRGAVADILAGWARDGGASHWRAALVAVLNDEQSKAA